MIVCDYLFMPEDVPKGDELTLLLTETILAHAIPSNMKNLPLAFVLHSDEAIDDDIELHWEIHSPSKSLGSFGGPMHVKLAPNEQLRSALIVPDFEILEEGIYTFTLFVDNKKLKDLKIEIRLPRE